MKTITMVLFAAALATCVSGCSTNPFTGETQISNTAIGAGGGAALGAGAGLAVGSITQGDPKTTALIGAGAGAVVGAGAGLLIDKQEEALRQELQSSGVSVVRNGKSTSLNMASNILFARGQSKLSVQAQKTLSSVAQVLVKYPKMNVLLDGHADSAEAKRDGETLSKRRAENVANYLASRNISASRLLVRGLGDSRPLATSFDANGEQANRAVEIQLKPAG